VEELDVADPDVEGRDAHVHAARGTHAAGVEAANWQRRLREIGDVDAGADDAAHEATFQHAAGTVLVAIHRDRRALLERRRIRSPQTGDELQREIDVHDAGDPEAAEKPAPSLRSPDEARADHRPGFDLLSRTDLHALAEKDGPR